MPKDYTSKTFSEVYKDDYSDEKGFHKILFNSGRALQARELTQLQTILQEQIGRFANNIFLDGAAVGSSVGADVASGSSVGLGSVAGDPQADSISDAITNIETRTSNDLISFTFISILPF